MCDAIFHAMTALALQEVAAVLRIYLNTQSDATVCNTVWWCLNSVQWRMEFKFAHWFCGNFGRIESWGDSCVCHQEEFLRHERVECKERGRLLAIAHDYVAEQLRSISREANEWTADDWNNDSTFLAETLGTTIASVNRTYQKTIYLDRLPQLIAQLGHKAGAREKCLQQFDQCDLTDHDRVTQTFFRPGGELRKAIDAMSGDFDLSDTLLSEAVQSIRDVPMCDIVNEGPHALFENLRKHSTGSKFAWKAASVRLDQNLQDCTTLKLPPQFTLQYFFDHFKMVLQTRNRRRDVRMPRADFEKQFYSCKLAFEPRLDTMDVPQFISFCIYMLFIFVSQMCFSNCLTHSAYCFHLSPPFD